MKEKQNQSVRLTLRWQSRAWQKLPEPVERKNEKKHPCELLNHGVACMWFGILGEMMMHVAIRKKRIPVRVASVLYPRERSAFQTSCPGAARLVSFASLLPHGFSIASKPIEDSRVQQISWSSSNVAFIGFVPTHLILGVSM